MTLPVVGATQEWQAPDRQTKDRQTQHWQKQDWQKLGQTLDQMRQAHQVPVMALTVFADHSIAHQQVYGAADVHVPLRWGSITKTFTALALNEALHEQGLDYDAPVSKKFTHLPWHNPWANKTPVTFRHLAELCTGLTDLTSAEFNDNTPVPRRQRLSSPSPSRVMRWPPGVQHSYTNVTPGLTAHVVEQLVQVPFEDYLSRKVFKPLGMDNASILPVAKLPGGFKADGRSEIPYWHLTYPAAGGLNASLHELSNALLILLNDGHSSAGKRILAEQTMRNLREPGCSPLSAQLDISYGAGYYGRVRQGHVFYGHGGDADGYRSRYGLLPEAGMGYVILINTDNPQLLRQLERKIEASIVKHLTVPDQPKIAQLTQKDLRQWQGAYYPSGIRFGHEAWSAGRSAKVEIRADGNSLLIIRSKRRTRLLPVDQQRFRREQDPVVTVAFARTSEGTLMQGELGNYVRIDDEQCPPWLAPVCRT